MRRRPAPPEYAEDAVWAADGEMVRAAYTLHPEDDDFGQANTLINHVMDDAARGSRFSGRRPSGASWRDSNERLCCSEAFEYWKNIDKSLGDRIEAHAFENRGR